MVNGEKRKAITPEKRRAVEKLVANRELVAKYGEFGKELMSAKKHLRGLRGEYRIESNTSLIPTVGKQRLSRAYEKIGDIYSNIGIVREALKYYHSAEQFAPYDPVKNRINDKISSLEESAKSDITRLLEQRAFAYLAIISLASSLFSISLKLTGNVVGVSSTKINWIALCLFGLGVMFTIFYFRAKKKVY